MPPLWGQLPLSALLEAAAASSSPKDHDSPPTTSGVFLCKHSNCPYLGVSVSRSSRSPQPSI